MRIWVGRFGLTSVSRRPGRGNGRRTSKGSAPGVRGDGRGSIEVHLRRHTRIRTRPCGPAGRAPRPDDLVECPLHGSIGPARAAGPVGSAGPVNSAGPVSAGPVKLLIIGLRRLAVGPGHRGAGGRGDLDVVVVNLTRNGRVSASPRCARGKDGEPRVDRNPRAEFSLTGHLVRRRISSPPSRPDHRRGEAH
jgi:hypothetical protein